MYIGQKHLARFAKGFFGENFGKPLAEWLNSRHGRKTRPVARAIMAAARQVRFADMVAFGKDQHTPPFGDSAAKELHESLKAPFTIKVRFVLHPALARQVPSISLLPVDTLSTALVFASRLYDVGLLGWVRQCRRAKCSQWFFARRANQTFCGADCQQRHWQESDDGLEYHRKKMSEYRENKKRREPSQRDFQRLTQRRKGQ